MYLPKKRRCEDSRGAGAERIDVGVLAMVEQDKRWTDLGRADWIGCTKCSSDFPDCVPQRFSRVEKAVCVHVLHIWSLHVAERNLKVCRYSAQHVQFHCEEGEVTVTDVLASIPRRNQYTSSLIHN